MSPAPDISIIIPAHNEAECIKACLEALLLSEGKMPTEVIVVPNGCTDETADKAKGMAEGFAARGWSLHVIELTAGNKIAALNAGDRAAQSDKRIYLDADVIVSKPLLGELTTLLDGPGAIYASGTLRMPPAKSGITRAYARIYSQVPFITHGVPGAGLFALNAAARARWDDWPQIISDDTFARLSFAPHERHMAKARYDWPLVEGWGALVRVRRRQNRGVEEIRERFPELLQNDDKPSLPLARKLTMALKDPFGFAIYAGVAIATKLGRSTSWERGR